jgi:hypothetical protein
MAERRIVVTGAGSWLGRRTVDLLAAGTGHQVLALTSPRGGPVPALARAGVRWRAVDLAAPLPHEVATAIAAADRVLHYAWDRRADASGDNAANIAMAQALAGLARPGALVFVSSVAGSPRARSAYGRNKHAVAALVRAAGGSVWLPGLVVDDPPQGPHAILCGVVRRVPVALRLTGGGPNVYPMPVATLLGQALALCAADLPPGTWQGFEAPVPFNTFLAGIEAAHPRLRLPVRLPTGPLVVAAAALRRLPLPTRRLSDKVLTLLWKDDAAIAAALPLPSPELAPAPAARMPHRHADAPRHP